MTGATLVADSFRKECSMSATLTPADASAKLLDVQAVATMLGCGIHLQHAWRDRCSVAIENRVGWRNTAKLWAVPPAPHDFDFAINGKNFVRLPAFIGQSLVRRWIVRRGEKRFPPHRHVSARLAQKP
ncbi:MAG: hypothetical protein ABFC77_00330, partial [Thermoguttaceae bacterium]